MSTRLSLMLLVIFSFSAPAFAQKADTLGKKLDSMQKKEEKHEPVVDVNKDEYTSKTNIDFKSYFVLLGTDMLQEVKSPFHASKKTYIIAGGFVALEAVTFFAADRPIQKSTTKFMSDNPNLRNTSQYITNFGASYEIYVLAGFAAYGLIFKSDKVKTTMLLATQAYITAGAMSEVVKFMTSRQRPNFTDASNPEPQYNVFNGPAILNGRSASSGFGSSFPSGHTTAAFSAATVYAYEYKNEILIPVLAYSAASLVGISRITQNAHWTSDVIAGAFLGYVTGKQVVNNYHRYARLKSGKKVDMSFHFDLQYNNGVVMPGMLCKF